jgi:hypothetical protein
MPCPCAHAMKALLVNSGPLSVRTAARIAPEGGRLVQQPGHVLAGDAEVGGDVDALMAEVVGHRQALDAPAVGQAVADEVHAPYLIDRFGDLQRHALAGRALRLLAFAHRQLGALYSRYTRL